MIGTIFTFFFFALMAMAIASSIRIVRHQTIGIVETFGKYSRVLQPGLNFILPFGISRIAHTVGLRIIEKRDMVEIKTSDNAFVKLPTSIMLRVDPTQAVDSFYKLGDPEKQISRWILNSVRSVTSQMTLNELFSDREKIKVTIGEELTAKLAEFGYTLETVLIEQPSVSTEVETASNRVVEAQREREAAQQEGEALRIKTVAAAKAESEAQVCRAEGISKSRSILVDGLRHNIEEISGTGASVKDVMDLLITINRLDAMRDVGSHGNLILMDTNSPQLALDARILRNTQNNSAAPLQSSSKTVTGLPDGVSAV